MFQKRIDNIRRFVDDDPKRAFGMLGVQFTGPVRPKAIEARCIFHRDRNPSAAVLVGGQTPRFFCYSCNTSFDIFALWMELHEGASFPDAVDALAALFGITESAGENP